MKTGGAYCYETRITRYLLDKPDVLKHPVDITYTGFVVPNALIVGDGVDYNEWYREFYALGILNFLTSQYKSLSLVWIRLYMFQARQNNPEIVIIY